MRLSCARLAASGDEPRVIRLSGTVDTGDTGDTGGTGFSAAPDPLKTRRYDIAAEIVPWDFAPSGRDELCGFTVPPAVVANRTRTKLRYFQSTDASFTARPHPSRPRRPRPGVARRRRRIPRRHFPQPHRPGPALAAFGVAAARADPMIERSDDTHRLGATPDNGSDDPVNASALAAAAVRFPDTAQLPAAPPGIRNFPPRPR